MAKFTEPVRLAITIAITPSMAKLMGRKIDERNEKIAKGEIKPLRLRFAREYQMNRMSELFQRMRRMRRRKEYD